LLLANICSKQVKIKFIRINSLNSTQKREVRFSEKFLKMPKMPEMPELSEGQWTGVKIVGGAAAGAIAVPAICAAVGFA